MTTHDPKTGKLIFDEKNSRPDEPGVKLDAGKPRYDLIPPEAMIAVADLFRIGAEKYGDRNWENGMSWGRIFRAMMSHAWLWWSGEEHDPVDRQHHLDSVIWCAMVLRTYIVRGPMHRYDDRPH